MKFTSGKVAIILFFLLTELIVYSHNNLAISFFKRKNNSYKKVQVPYKKKIIILNLNICLQQNQKKIKTE